MPLVLACGQPVSGKSTVVQQLAALLKQHDEAVLVLKDEQSRNEIYKGKCTYTKSTLTCSHWTYPNLLAPL